MSDANGNGERMRAIAQSENLQAWARISMVTAPPLIAGLIGVASWYLSGLSSEIRVTRDIINAYIADDRSHGARRDAELKEHGRRIDTLETHVFRRQP